MQTYLHCICWLSSYKEINADHLSYIIALYFYSRTVGWWVGLFECRQLPLSTGGVYS